MKIFNFLSSKLQSQLIYLKELEFAKLLKLQTYRQLINLLNLKRVLIICGFSLSMVLGIIFIFNNPSTKTYYIAYVGRYQRAEFELLHELALRKYLDELNVDLIKKGVRLELRTFNNEDVGEKSSEIYKVISEDNNIVIVIDNTWGKHINEASYLIREKGIPVISINADKQVDEFGKNVVFIGHDNMVPNLLTQFSKKILQNNEIIFIKEEEYKLSNKFEEEFKKNSITFEPSLSVKNSKPDEKEEASLFHSLDIRLKNIQEHPATVIIGTHSNWGNKIIDFIDKKYKGVNILGGPYIISWSIYGESYGKFGKNGNNNSLILFTTPKDTILSKSSDDIKSISNVNGKVSEMFSEVLFIKRCLDAVSLIRGAFSDDFGSISNSEVSKANFIDFFQNKLFNSNYMGEYDVYSFDQNLLLLDERTFKKHSQGRVFSYPYQLKPSNLQLDKEVIPSVNFGLDINNISNIDLEKRSFHADFYYWFRYDKNSENVNLEKAVNFRNEIRPISDEQEIDSGDLNASESYKLFKRSGDFRMDVDFKKYPFDTQKLKIELELVRPNAGIQLSFEPGSLEQSKNKVKGFKVNEWRIQDFYVTSDYLPPGLFRNDHGNKAIISPKSKILNIQIPISRVISSQVIKFLPLGIIGIVVIALLFIKDGSFSHIGGVCVGIFLSLATYTIAFAQNNPKSDLLTIGDLFFYLTFVVVLLVFSKVILFNSDIINKESKVSKWVNERSHLIAIITMTCYLLITFVLVIYGSFI